MGKDGHHGKLMAKRYSTCVNQSFISANNTDAATYLVIINSWKHKLVRLARMGNRGTSGFVMVGHIPISTELANCRRPIRVLLDPFSDLKWIILDSPFIAVLAPYGQRQTQGIE